jgi:hypothetical protein
MSPPARLRTLATSNHELVVRNPADDRADETHPSVNTRMHQPPSAPDSRRIRGRTADRTVEMIPQPLRMVGQIQGPSGPDSRPSPSHVRPRRHRRNLESHCLGPDRSPRVHADVATSAAAKRAARAPVVALALHLDLRQPLSPTPSILSVGYANVLLGLPRRAPACQRRSLRLPSFGGRECVTGSTSSGPFLDVAAEDRFPPIRPPQRLVSRNQPRAAGDTATTRHHREQDITDKWFRPRGASPTAGTEADKAETRYDQ